MMPTSPTAPRPKTAIDEPGPTRSTSRTAPAPVSTPQPNGPRIVGSASGETLMVLLTWVTAYVDQDDWAKAWLRTGVPRSSVRAVEPSLHPPEKFMECREQVESAFEYFQVGAADSGRPDLDQDFVVADAGHLQPRQGDVVRPAHDRGLCRRHHSHLLVTAGRSAG